MHALKGLACRKRVAPASSPAAPASSAQRSRRLHSTLAAAPGLLAHAEVTTIIIYFSMGPKLSQRMCMRSKAWLAAAPVLLAHAEVTKT